MRALEISDENLEDLLIYDDLFLDYFNAFLQLPAFPQPLYYNRLTGTFQEVDGNDLAPILGDDVISQNPPYGATDEERERMLEWAKEERLPLFLGTSLFREYKLCKLLLRQLADHYSSSRQGSAIRGYSRQTDSYVSSLSNTADNSANEDEEEEDEYSWGDLRKSNLFKYDRPGSRALSLPPKMGFFDDSPSEQAEDTADTNRTASQQTSKTSKDDNSAAVKAVGRNAPSTIAATIGGSTRMSGQMSGFDMSFNREATFATRNETLASIFENEAGNDHRDNRVDIALPIVEIQSPPRSPKAKSDKKKKSKKEKKQNKNAAPDSADMYMKLFQDKHKRAISAPINYNEFMRIPNYHDFDAIFGEVEPEEAEPYLEFGANEDEETETSLKNLEGKHNMSMQQLKEGILGSMEGMENLKDFLSETMGIDLYNFWLDCESFKETLENFSEAETLAARNRFFRDVQDRYKMKLTQDARDQIVRAANNIESSHSIFIRVQYDVLRRMRSYWVPRYLLHKEATSELSNSIRDILVLNQQEMSSVDKELSSTFLPSISLANSIPVKPEQVISAANNNNWDFVSKYGRKWDERIKSAKIHFHPREPIKTLQDRMLKALVADKTAGGPFQKFLVEQSDPRQLSSLLFWQDVSQYSAEEDRSADRLLRMCHAWSIFNEYLAVNSPHNIGIDVNDRDRLHKMLLNSRDFVEASVFSEAKEFVVSFLEKPWIRFLKEDMRSYLDCQIHDDNESITTAEDIEVIVVREKLIIRRPKPWVRKYPQSTDSERGRRLRTALSVADSIDEARKSEMKKRKLERRKQMDKERKKAIRAAKKRQMEARNKKNVKFEPPKEDGEAKDGQSPPPGSIYDGVGTPQPEEKPVEFKDMAANKQIMGMFKKYITEHESKEKLNQLNLYLDIDSYNSLEGKKKKDVHATFLFKNYLDVNSKKHVKMTDKTMGKLKHDKERPKSSTLKDCQHHIVHQIDELFKKFWESQAEELGIDSRALAGMTKAELALRAGDDILGKSWKKRGKQKSTARAQPSREDKVDFLLNLSQASQGKWPIKMWYFLKFLIKHGDEEGFPFLDKDLTFYLEVQQFKDSCHSWADEELLKRKVASINLIYLESNIAPALQIDINGDILFKTTRAAQRFPKELDHKIFDDAYFAVFKELLPFWAGFVKTYKPPEKNKQKIPLTKQQKMVKKRMEEFQNMPIPKTQFKLPNIPRGGMASFQFSLTDGVKWRDIMEVPIKDDGSIDTLETDIKDKGSRLGLHPPLTRRASNISTSTVTGATTRPPLAAK